MRARIDVMLRDGILDPQGSTVEQNLPSLGFDGVRGVRIGKHIELELDARDLVTAQAQVEEMATRLLSNPVIEDFTYTIDA